MDATPGRQCVARRQRGYFSTEAGCWLREAVSGQLHMVGVGEGELDAAQGPSDDKVDASQARRGVGCGLLLMLLEERPCVKWTSHTRVPPGEMLMLLHVVVGTGEGKA